MFPRWMTWLVLIFIVYIVFVGNSASDRQTVTAEKGVAEAPRDYPALREVADTEHWKRAINPEYAKTAKACDMPEAKEGEIGLTVVVKQEGTGEPIACGQAGWFGVTVWNARGQIAHITKEPVKITLGGEEAFAAISPGLQGMKIGEVRQLIVPPALVKRMLPSKNEGEVAVIEVARAEHSPTAE